MEKKNVLITGVTSSVGRNLAIHLSHNPKIGLIYGVGRDEKPYYFREVDNSKFVYRQCNILKHRNLKDLFLSQHFRDAGINTVVHLAFHNRLIRGENVHRLNVLGTENLIEHCLQSDSIQKFIFKSSDVVYKLRPNNPIFLDEEAELNFDTDADQWIKDRVDADMICQSFMTSKKMKIVILRLSNIVGRNISEQFNAYFGSKLIFRTMGFNPMINLLHMKDVIQAITLSIFKNVGGVFNIAGADTAPISAFAELAHAKCIGLPAKLLGPTNWLQRKLGLTNYYYSVDRERQKYTALLDHSKAMRLLGYEPQGRVEL